MFIPIFMILLTPLATGVISLAHLYNLELSWQKKQILLDNAAIRLGRNDLTVFNELEKDRTKLVALHEKYHSFLACSLVPATALNCAKVANLLRRLIRSWYSMAIQKATTGWFKGTMDTLREVNNASPRVHLSRNSKLPINRKKCPICLENIGWDLSSINQTRSSLQEQGGANLSVSVSLLREVNGKWNYRMWAK